jgi:transporter family-2 protein
MSPLFLFALMFFAGITVALQPSINARLAQHVGSLQSAFYSFAVGALALSVVVLFNGRLQWRALAATRWWEWSGGLLGAFFVTITIFMVPRIGTTAAMAATIAAQLTTGIVLDHYGFFGMRIIPVDGTRIVGALFLATGALLIFRR